MRSLTLMNENVLSIWDHSAKHKKDARGLEKLRGEIDVAKQNKTELITQRLRQVSGRMPDWRSLGPGLVQGI